MRFLLMFAIAASAFGLDNSVRLTERTGSDQSNRPFTIFRSFAKDEICDYPQPFVSGTGLSPWQSDVWTRWPASSFCSAGSVKTAYVSFKLTLSANQTVAVEFRNNTNACSSGDQSACYAASLGQSAMLGYNGGTWNGKLEARANPLGSTTVRSADARTIMTSGLWSYRLRGPVVTQVVVEDRSAARTFDFGWREFWAARITAYVGPSVTAISVEDAAHWVNLPRPFKVVLDNEIISICYATATTLTVGLTNGTSPSCADTNGHGQNGTVAGDHGPGLTNFLRLYTGTWITADLNSYDTHFTVNDASSLSVPTVVQVAQEQIRVCGKSGNQLLVSANPSGCTENSNGRFYRGTTFSYGRPAFTPVFDILNRTDRWIDANADRYKSLHPAFVVTFYPGWSGVGMEYHLFNQWTDRLQDQEYDLNLYSGSGGTTPIATRTLVRHIPNTNWKFPDGPDVGRFTSTVSDRKYWDGSAPGAIRYDFNLPYLRYVGVVPYDPTVQINDTAIAAALTVDTGHSSGTNYAWQNGSKCQIETGDILNAFRGNAGPYHRGMADPGARFDIAINPAWYVYGLYAMNSSLAGAERWAEWTFGSGACSGLINVHYTEGGTGLNYCASGESQYCPTCKSCTGANLTATATGRPISIDARPGIAFVNNQISADDPVRPVGQTTLNYWLTGDGASHFPEAQFIPYMLSGDWYYEQNLATTGAWLLMAANSYPGVNMNDFTAYYQQQFRHGSWGWFGPYNGSRPIGWSLRGISNAAWAMKDNSPEQQYFVKKLNTHIAISEGKYNMTKGMYYEPCTSTCTDDYSYWIWGRRRQGYNTNNITVAMNLGTVGGYIPSDLSTDDPTNGTYVDYHYTFGARSFWMDMYYYMSMADAEQKGFTQLRPLRTTVHTVLLNWLRNPVMNPFTIGEYRVPNTPCQPEGVYQPTGCPNLSWNTIGQEFTFSSWSAIAQAFTATAKNRNGFINDRDLSGGYSRLGFAMSNFLPDGVAQGTLRGSAAYDWINANIKYKNEEGNNPFWKFLPKVQINNVLAQAGTTEATISASSSTSDACKIAVSPTQFASWTDDGDADATMNGLQIVHRFTGLTPGTTYYYRIGCGPANRLGRVRGSFTTAGVAGAAVTIPLSLAAPPNRGVANVLVDYGTTNALGSNVSAACSGVCTVNLPSAVNQLTYYRITFRDASNNAIAQGRILSAVGSAQ